MHINLRSRLYSEPWAIDLPSFTSFAEKLDSYLSGRVKVDVPQITSRTAIVGPVDFAGGPMIPQLEVISGIGLIRCSGVLARGVGWLDAYFGAYDYDWLAAFIRQALEDRSINSIVIDLNTPGGSHVGMEETAALIAKANAVKPIIAYTSGLCCSAGYALAHECASIVASPSSMVGSLGSKLIARDTSQMFADAGIRVEVFTSGADGQELPLKAMHEPGKPITEPEREFFRNATRQAGAWVEKVKEKRPQATGSAFQGGWVFGSQALADGLIDSIASGLDELLAAMLS